MTIFKKIAYVTVLATLFNSNINANCTRHIYNNSNQPWRFTYTTTDGNVYIQGISCNVNGPCQIPPHTTVTTEYSHRHSAVAGKVNFSDANNNEKTFYYYGTGMDNPCPFIKHSGKTGSVSVNEPAEGDFTIDQDAW